MLYMLPPTRVTYFSRPRPKALTWICTSDYLATKGQLQES
jgi:hypothetical protein